MQYAVVGISKKCFILTFEIKTMLQKMYSCSLLIIDYIAVITCVTKYFDF